MNDKFYTSPLSGKVIDLEKPFDVLMLAVADSSNSGIKQAMCLEHLGFDVVFYKGLPHEFEYPIQAPIHWALSEPMCRWEHGFIIHAPQLKSLVEKAKVVYFHASMFIDTGADLSDKFIVVNHQGSTYRKHSQVVNQLFNSIADKTIVYADLMNMGCTNEVLFYRPVETNLLRPVYEPQGEKLIIGHFPSTPANKGTENILQVIKKLKSDPTTRDKFEYVGISEVIPWTSTARHGDPKKYWVPWKDQINRYRQCDIIIESLLLELHGRKFGEWGNTAIEASSLGKIVITNSLTAEVYKEEFGVDSELNIANSKKDLEDTLRKIFALSSEELQEKKQRTREWIKKNHNIAAAADQLWEKVYKWSPLERKGDAV